METLKQQLINREEIIFDNELFCEQTQSDDFRCAECSFDDDSKHSFQNGFKIRFNGGLFIFKTFKSFEKKLNQLITDWNLELKTE